jgi:hypothetical protein
MPAALIGCAAEETVADELETTELEEDLSVIIITPPLDWLHALTLLEPIGEKVPTGQGVQIAPLE